MTGAAHASDQRSRASTDILVLLTSRGGEVATGVVVGDDVGSFECGCLVDTRPDPRWPSWGDYLVVPLAEFNAIEAA